MGIFYFIIEWLNLFFFNLISKYKEKLHKFYNSIFTKRTIEGSLKKFFKSSNLRKSTISNNSKSLGDNLF